MSASPMPHILHRFFFALKPDQITARRTYAFAERELGAKGLLTPERHHVTLAITDDRPHMPVDLVKALLSAGDAVDAQPFALSLDRLSVNYGTIALRPSRVVRQLRALQASIATAMAAQGVPMREDWSFNPHETLCYRKTTTPATRTVPPFHWSVSEFVLVHSYVGAHRHETIGRWSLHADDRQGQLL